MRKSLRGKERRQKISDHNSYGSSRNFFQSAFGNLLLLSELNVGTDGVEDAGGDHALDDAGAQEQSPSDELSLVDVQVGVFAVAAAQAAESPESPDTTGTAIA